MIEVRPFLNHDPPAIASVINECCNLEATVSTSLLEFAVFAKTYFDRQRLFVASIAGEVRGFVHLGSEATDDHESSTLTISNFLASEADLDISESLLGAVIEFAKERGFRKLRIGTEPNLAEYYNGISTHFLNVGIPDTHPMLPTLTKLGFETVDHFHCLSFCPRQKPVPFTRAQMNLRREYTLELTADPDFNDLSLNAIYSHLATNRIDLTHCETGKSEASLIYASLAHSYPDWPAGGVDVIDYSSDGPFDKSHYELMLCEVLRQLPQTCLTPLRLHIDANDHEILETAEGIGFERAITSVHVEYEI